MPSQKYSVLLMRDDQSVRRFAFNPKWFWFSVLTFIVLLVVSCVSAYGVFVFYHQNEELKRQVSGLERELHSKNLDLEKLSTLKKFFEENDPEELIALLGSMDDPQQPVPEDQPPSLEPREIDLGLLAIENLSLKEQDGNSLRVSFDLSVVNEEETQAGQVELEFITTDGRILDLDANPADMNFQIQRFKKIVTSFSQPEDVAMDDIMGLRVTITDQTGDATFQKTYELSSIMTP